MARIEQNLEQIMELLTQCEERLSSIEQNQGNVQKESALEKYLGDEGSRIPPEKERIDYQSFRVIREVVEGSVG